MPALVIFDCDGVLIDSEVIFGRVLGECLIAGGFQISIAEAMMLGIGKNRLTLTAEVEARFGRPLPERFFETMRARVDIAFERELRAIPGIEELLAALAAPRCVASNSHIDRVRQALSVTRLLPLFEPHVFSASQVARGKPAPDLFLFAARQLERAAGRLRRCRGQHDRCRSCDRRWHARGRLLRRRPLSRRPCRSACYRRMLTGVRKYGRTRRLFVRGGMRVIQISDTHLSAGKPHFADNWAPLAAWIEEQRPDLVIHTGDVTVDGADAPEDMRYSAGLMQPSRRPISGSARQSRCG